MSKTYKLKYGKIFLNVDLPCNTETKNTAMYNAKTYNTKTDNAEIINIQEPEFCITKGKFTQDFSLSLPFDLSNCTVATFAVSIVVADKTRLCDYKIYLPWLLEILQKKNILRSQIQFFIAYGTHAKQSDKECLACYGDVYKDYTFIHHDSDDKSLFTYLGKTKQSTKIHVRKDILESDLIITFGALSHHYFAGYGGGRKLLFPGLGYKPDIYHNHELFLNKTLKKLEPGCQPGNLDNNPLADDLIQIDNAVKTPKIAIHAILDSKTKACQLFVGKTYDDFLKACKILDSYYKVKKKKQYDIVIASCGGFPKDINFIQAHKAINNAAKFVKDKGVLIVLAQCTDGIGSDTFLEYFEFKNFSYAFKELENNYKGNGGTALSMMEKTNRIKIFIHSGLDETICQKINMQKINTDMAKNDNMIKALIKNHQKTAIINNASLLVW
jgi:nickel-dependent lactate racemase